MYIDPEADTVCEEHSGDQLYSGFSGKVHPTRLMMTLAA